MKSILAFLLIILTARISAQEKLAVNNVIIGMCANNSAERISNNKLNNFLSSNNYFESSSTIKNTSLGLSIRDTEGKSMFRFTFQNGKSASDALKSSTLSLNGVGFEYLYDFTKTNKWLAAPALGLSLNNYNLNAASQNSTSSLSGENLVENFQIENKFLSSIGLEIDRQIKLSYLIVHLGLKGYYSIEFKNSKWETTKSKQLNTIPSVDFSGYGISFNVRIEFNIMRNKQQN